MIQNQIIIYNNVTDHNKAQFGVLMDGILQEENWIFSPRQIPSSGAGFLPLCSGHAVTK